jgi:AcrR family transcriptional regulator
MSKTGLYYYYSSKDALVFELVFGAIEGQAHAVHKAVQKAKDESGAVPWTKPWRNTALPHNAATTGHSPSGPIPGEPAMSYFEAFVRSP